MTRLSPRTALIVFTALFIFVIAQATWWVIFMAQLVDEKVELAEQLTTDSDVVARIHEEEVDRQVMIGLEGLVFLLVLAGGLWIIYKAYIRLQDLNRRQENFLMATTHELKTPLSSIIVYLDALESDRIPNERKAEILPRIREDTRRLQRLVERFLHASRIGRATEVHTEHKAVDFGKLVQERVQSLVSLPGQKQVTVDDEFTPGLYVHGNRESLVAAVDHILENAVKYTFRDDVHLSVRVDRIGRHVRLRVTDNGIGLSKDDLERIFDRFERVGDELTRGFEGTGLGLYLCREIIAAHNGQVKAFSKGHKMGSTFEITLKEATN